MSIWTDQLNAWHQDAATSRLVLHELAPVAERAGFMIEEMATPPIQERSIGEWPLTRFIVVRPHGRPGDVLASMAVALTDDGEGIRGTDPGHCYRSTSFSALDADYYRTQFRHLIEAAAERLPRG